MERPAIDQATDLLTRGREILLAVPEKPSADAFSAMIALGLALESLEKKPTMIAASHVPPALQFLPGTSQVQDHLAKTTDLVVDIPTGGVRAADVRWETVPDHVRVFLTPERGKNFSVGTPTARAGMYPWETIVVLGSPDLSHLGAPFTEHASFFYETPILNIDRGTANEFFGTVNLVPATAGTVSEVVYDLLDVLGGVNLLTKDVATALYAGLITGTHSFQAPNTTPRTFAIASALLAQDADRQTVTRQLFKTHTLPELRLIGRALARMKELESGTLWSLLVLNDFTESGGSPDDLPMILQEIVERAGERTPVLLVFERHAGMLEVLIFPGRLSMEDRESLREKTNGTLAGPFVLATLGKHKSSDAERVLTDVILPHLIDTGAVREPTIGIFDALAPAGHERSR